MLSEYCLFDDDDDNDDNKYQCKVVHVGRYPVASSWLTLSNSVQEVSLISFLVAIFYGCEGDDIGVCCG